MYYVFKTEIRGWRNNILYAKLHKYLPEVQREWWFARPFEFEVPPITFEVSAKAPKPDNYYTATLSIELYSLRMIEIIKTQDVKFELFPVTFLTKKTKEPLTLPYMAFHLLEIEPGIDLDKSILGLNTKEKIVLTEECEKMDKPFFRLKESFNLVLINDRLKTKFEQAKITGCTYIPISKYS